MLLPVAVILLADFAARVHRLVQSTGDTDPWWRLMYDSLESLLGYGGGK